MDYLTLDWANVGMPQLGCVASKHCIMGSKRYLSGNVISLGEARGVAGMTTLAQRHPETRFVSDGATQALHSV